MLNKNEINKIKNSQEGSFLGGLIIVLLIIGGLYSCFDNKQEEPKITELRNVDNTTINPYEKPQRISQSNLANMSEKEKIKTYNEARDYVFIEIVKECYNRYNKATCDCARTGISFPTDTDSFFEPSFNMYVEYANNPKRFNQLLKDAIRGCEKK